VPSVPWTTTALDHRAEMTIRFTIWNQVTGTTNPPTTA
jgi:hypothetical protein